MSLLYKNFKNLLFKWTILISLLRDNWLTNLKPISQVLHTSTNLSRNFRIFCFYLLYNTFLFNNVLFCSFCLVQGKLRKLKIYFCMFHVQSIFSSCMFFTKKIKIIANAWIPEINFRFETNILETGREAKCLTKSIMEGEEGRRRQPKNKRNFL